jgi:ribonucleoside-triphosphate reductase
MDHVQSIKEENACPRCSSTNIDCWSRITGYLQNLDGWNPGKVQELKERHKYRQLLRGGSNAE